LKKQQKLEEISQTNKPIFIPKENLKSLVNLLI